MKDYYVDEFERFIEKLREILSTKFDILDFTIDKDLNIYQEGVKTFKLVPDYLLDSNNNNIDLRDCNLFIFNEVYYYLVSLY